MGNSPVTVDGTIHVVYNEWLFQGVGAHGQCFDGVRVNEIMCSTAIKECFSLGHLVPHVNSQRNSHRVLLCTVHVGY